MDLFVVRVVAAADRMLVIGMGVPGETPAVIDMAVVMAPPNHHKKPGSGHPRCAVFGSSRRSESQRSAVTAHHPKWITDRARRLATVGHSPLPRSPSRPASGNGAAVAGGEPRGRESRPRSARHT